MKVVYSNEKTSSFVFYDSGSMTRNFCKEFMRSIYLKDSENTINSCLNYINTKYIRQLYNIPDVFFIWIKFQNKDTALFYAVWKGSNE